jgi:RHS repeat-associated protein
MQVTNTSSDQYFGSRRVAVLDQLGSAGNSTFSQGTYYPWGEVKGGTNPQNAWSFATYWQDSSSGLDYAKNRYYSNMLGRFITPDPSRSSGGPSNPQSWNRYSYASGDPVNRLDPAGLMDTAVCDFDGNEADCFGSGGGDDGGEFCDASQQSCDTCFAADGIGFLPGPGCPGNGGPPTITTSSAPPPPCQDDWGNVDQTLESLGTNILSIAEQKIPGLTSQETSALGGTIQSDITSEMNTIMAAGTGNTSPPFFEGGHYNLDITTQQINNDLGPLGQTFIKDFTVGLFGTLDGVRQSAPNQPGYTLHSKAAGNQVDFHFDRFGYRNLPGHWGYDVGYGSLSHACLDPVWQH